MMIQGRPRQPPELQGEVSSLELAFGAVIYSVTAHRDVVVIDPGVTGQADGEVAP